MFLQNINKFYQNLGYATIASIASFIISLALTPIMTRWYAPTDYGTFALINNIATFTSTAMLFSLPNALPVEKFEYRRIHLLRALIDLIFISTLVTFIMVLFYIWGTGGSKVFLILPLLVFAIGVHRTAQGWANAEGDFVSMAWARVVHPLVAKPFAIIASMLSGSTPIYLVVFEVFGYVSQMAIMLKRRWKKLISLGSLFSKKRILKTYKTIQNYSDFALYLNLVSLMSLGFITLQVIIISMHYSVAQTGLFTLALSMSALPLQLVSMATAAIVYHKFIHIAQVNPERLFKYVVLSAGGYAFMGTVPYAILYYYAPSLFAVVFGEEWRESGQIAAILALPLFLQFISMPIASVFRITHKIKLQFWVDTLFIIPIIIVFYLLSQFMVFLEALEIFAIVLSVYSVSVLLFIFFVAYRYSYIKGSV